MGPKGDHGDSFFTLDSSSQTIHLKDYNLAIMGAPNSGKGNLIVGPNHSFAGCTNCVVFGAQNYAAGNANTVAGNQNAVRGDFNSVGGGALNSLDGEASAIGGGQHQQARGMGVFISSGEQATATQVPAQAMNSMSSLGTQLAPIGAQLSQPGGGQLMSGGPAGVASPATALGPPGQPGQPGQPWWYKEAGASQSQPQAKAHPQMIQQSAAGTPLKGQSPSATGGLLSGGIQAKETQFPDPWWYRET